MPKGYTPKAVADGGAGGGWHEHDVAVVQVAVLKLQCRLSDCQREHNLLAEGHAMVSTWCPDVSKVAA